MEAQPGIFFAQSGLLLRAFAEPGCYQISPTQRMLKMTMLTDFIFQPAENLKLIK